MKLLGLELTNFRSYERAAFELNPSVTLVVGPNASGKTNLLEAVYVLASTRSFRAKDRDLVRHGEDFFRVVARGEEAELALGFRHSPITEKRVTHDGAKKTLVAHVGVVQVTLFEPSDLTLLTGPPEPRRKYLDFLLSQTDRMYLRTLQAYRRTLKQRNALLDPERPMSLRDDLFVWDVKLAELAVEIFGRRQELVRHLNRLLPEVYSRIAGEHQEPQIVYQPSVSGDYAEEFLSTLQANIRRDMAVGFTTIGPHREDFAVTFKGTALELVASRGEVRTVVLAMKLAEVAYAEQATGIRPILLLDDVFSELDRERRSYLVGQLGNYQAIITTTDADAIAREFTVPHSIISTGRAND